MTLLGFALAVLIGISLGLLGGGGSILTVPVFVYVLGYDPKPAIAMTLPVIGTAALVGAAGHWRSGNVQLRTALLFGAVAMVGAYLGARLAAFVSGPVQLATLGIVMVAAALSMLRRSSDLAAGERRSPIVLLAAGIGVGVLTGFVGIGGGFLVVPALVLLAGVPMKQAVGTSLVVIVMNAAAGFAGYVGQVTVPWTFLAAFTCFAVAGILVGTRLVRHVSAAQLRRGFAVFLLAVAALVLYQNRGAFVPGAASSAAAPAP